MTLHLGIPLVVALIGAGVYGFAKDKVAEIGRILFFCGTLVTLMHLN